MKGINNFFFGYEEISLYDSIWMYGSYALWTFIVGLIVLQVY
ncbi:hypothetical protein [Sporosarcina limicola]|uniref:Uncharacterized protein n=1 Tax=Sporosarcina limicola TaxID=34101 RepID=A0A927MQA6_9BACL|nr:hypothetical protein [Sporosarcina limicola]MBE1557007.1 hypothetical protein [Sporosarcina limicola]